MANSIDDDIREEFSKHHSVFKTAKKLGLDNIEYVANVVKGMDKQPKPDTSTCEFEGFGDPEKKSFLVARSLATEVWDNGRPEVANARSKYEEGTHIMATGRDGPWILLYLFPRMVKEPRPNYFTPTIEG